MRPWMRYGVAVLVVGWIVGNIPAWLFLPTYTGTAGGQDSYAIWWTLAPVLALTAGCVGFMAWQIGTPFLRWVVGGGRAERDAALAERIAELERDLGIGQPPEPRGGAPRVLSAAVPYPSGTTLASEVEMVELHDHTGKVIARYKRRASV